MGIIEAHARKNTSEEISLTAKATEQAIKFVNTLADGLENSSKQIDLF